MIKDREEALAAHEIAQRRIAERRKNMFAPFVKGQKVWLDTWNLKTSYHKKMAPKQEGLFEIEEVIGLVTYQLKLPKDWKIHMVLLKPYTETDVHGKNYTQPPPELLEEQEVYEVEMIIKHWKWGWGYQYFIKWKGYPIEEATWELESNISQDGNMLEQYKLWHQLWNQPQEQKKKKSLTPSNSLSLQSL